MRQKIKPFLLLLLAVATLGYIREFFFVHLNIIMYSKFYHNPPQRPLPFVMQPFEHFSYAQLYYSKYFYTMLFVLLYYLMNRLAIKKITGNPFILKVLFYAYALMLILAALSMLYGSLVNDRLQDDEYTLSRWLLGVAQSPIICLILLASGRLHKKNVEV